MGLLDGIRAMVEPLPAVLERPEPAATLERGEGDASATAQLILDAIEARRSSMSEAEAMRLPAVRRAYDLITSTAAQFTPRAGVARQPSIVDRPDPYCTRYEFVRSSVDCLFRGGDLYWQPLGTSGLRVLDPAEVEVRWDRRKLFRLYSWRGQDMAYGAEIRHIALGRGAGQLRGTSPLKAALPYLAVVAAAEDYAMAFFASGGVPEIVLKVASKLTQEEARLFKQQWMESRSGPEPAVLHGGMEAEFPATDPQKAQMQESRAYGATVVARLFGIPAALLHVETSGATITYTNPAGAIDDLVKSTILPLYLRPLEEEWSDLAGTAVRFDLDELARSDITTRASIDTQLVGAQILTVDEVRPRWSEATT